MKNQNEIRKQIEKDNEILTYHTLGRLDAVYTMYNNLEIEKDAAFRMFLDVMKDNHEKLILK